MLGATAFRSSRHKEKALSRNMVRYKKKSATITEVERKQNNSNNSNSTLA